MRIALAAIALTAATPALAQRVDTRRIDVRKVPAPHYVTCGFSAVDRLRLDEYTGGSAARAYWSAPRIGAPAAGSLRIDFAPVQDDPSAIEVERAGVLIVVPEHLPEGASARLLVDGVDAGYPLVVGRSDPPTHYAIMPVEGDAVKLVEAMIPGALAEVVLRDPSGAELGRIAFDVHELRRIPELLELVHWRCTSPDRG